jgi:hypothetical protein
VAAQPRSGCTLAILLKCCCAVAKVMQSCHLQYKPCTGSGAAAHSYTLHNATQLYRCIVLLDTSSATQATHCRLLQRKDRFAALPAPHTPITHSAASAPTLACTRTLKHNRCYRLAVMTAHTRL